MISRRVVTDIPPFVQSHARGQPPKAWDDIHVEIDSLTFGDTLLVPRVGIFAQDVVSAVSTVSRHTGKKFFTRKIVYEGTRHYAVQWRPD